MSRSTNKDLRRWFLDYRRKYFPHLPLSIVVQFSRSRDPQTMEYLAGRCKIFGPWIFIAVDPPLADYPTFARQVLLHEMIHAQLNLAGTYGGHGKRFKRHKGRLWRKGAYENLL